MAREELYIVPEGLALPEIGASGGDVVLVRPDHPVAQLSVVKHYGMATLEHVRPLLGALRRHEGPADSVPVLRLIREEV